MLPLLGVWVRKLYHRPVRTPWAGADDRGLLPIWVVADTILLVPFSRYPSPREVIS